ncbi:MAG: 3-deoxy-8-phosphooctulonate synthase [Candidatus Aminicenantaceae bacterium]
MSIVPREIGVTPDLCIGGFQTFFLIAGPCVIESEEHAFFMAGALKQICDEVSVPFIFKASYDKANRSALDSFRGPGQEEGLKILAQIKQELKIPVLSDVHETGQMEKAAEVLDIIQIPALLCRQTDLLLAAAGTGKPINIKKGQFLAPGDMKNAVDKVLSQGNQDIILTERGTCFGYNNLVFDVRAVPIMKEWGFPVCVDASHSVQRPGGRGTASGGDAAFIPHVARAAMAVGADGLFLEVHDKPSRALSDKHNSLILNDLSGLLATLRKVRSAVFRKRR